MRFSVFLVWIVAGVQPVYSGDTEDLLHYVNPFIGSGRSPVPSNWDGYGGTYPGAVAPFGFIQLSPETDCKNGSGYDYQDDSISFFSCIGHKSGYPSGSAGQVFIMPVNSTEHFDSYLCGRPFSHNNETAVPGYYRVVLTDNGSCVEATATERTGMFRFTFPEGVEPGIFIGDIGTVSAVSRRLLHGSKRNVVLAFDSDCAEMAEVEGGNILRFPRWDAGSTVLLLKISTSSVGHENAAKNMHVEIRDWDFDQVKEATQRKWRNALSAVEIDDSNDTNKTIFYTALYHSMLMPWVISDVDGSYRDRRGTLCATRGSNQYGAFSPWDTFRSLHPLLCLLMPDRQKDMILSMLDHYQDTGWLPTAPMTGNHAIPIIVDSYFKGITEFDTATAFAAMKKSILGPEYFHKDMEVYSKLGYLPFTYSESVTKTVEYAYNDWVLAMFSGSVMHREQTYTYLRHRSFNYRNLFHPESLFLLPRNENEFRTAPGTFGYKEGDKWIYTLFVPHNPQDLINLTGGSPAFAARLDSAFSNNRIVFDNEPAFHIPYLFNYALEPSNTQKWLHHVRAGFKNSPGGLPGNDDLGSLSSWYVFSAMGFFPVCPGKPVYDIGAPVFNGVTIHPGEDKAFVIRANNVSLKNHYIGAAQLNGKTHNRSWISHSTVAQGGELVFEMDSIPNEQWASGLAAVAQSETRHTPDFHVGHVTVSKEEVVPDEKFWIRFSIVNTGSLGTQNVALHVNGKTYASKNILMEENTQREDSIDCRLYMPGNAELSINGTADRCTVTVIHNNLEDQFKLEHLRVIPLLKPGEEQEVRLSVRNTGGHKDTASIHILENEKLVHSGRVILLPGEVQIYSHRYIPRSTGVCSVRVQDLAKVYKVYSNNLESSILDLSLIENANNIVADQSGFSNHGDLITRSPGLVPSSERVVFGENTYVEVASEDAHIATSTITMMAWVRAAPGNGSPTALITKGDRDVLQLHGSRHLTFFTGGWGRGECQIDLPGNWVDSWHHVAGVSDGHTLKVYIDGLLKGSAELGENALAPSKCNWSLGRNAEFPGERIFRGSMAKVKVFAEPLSEDEINQIVRMEKSNF